MMHLPQKLDSAYSPKQVANLQNAQHSTGPKTDAGKAISKLNATVHNLRGQFRLLPHEDAQAYVFQLQAAMHEYAPVGVLESKLVIQLVHCQWQIDRTADHLYRAEAYSQTLEEQLKLMDKFSLYRQRFLRERKGVLNELKTLQTERGAAPRTPLTPDEWDDLTQTISQLDADTLASFVHFTQNPHPATRQTPAQPVSSPADSHDSASHTHPEMGVMNIMMPPQTLRANHLPLSRVLQNCSKSVLVC